MNILPLSVACPKCGRHNVSYSCTPNCCFNHVCGDCFATFELRTEARGEVVEGFSVKENEAERDTTRPTTACARCESIEVYRWQNGSPDSLNDPLVCLTCGALLTLKMDLS